VSAGQVSCSLNSIDGLGDSPVVRGVGVWVWPSYESDVTVYLDGDQAGTTKTTRVPTGGWSYVTSGGAGPGHSIVIVNRVQAGDAPAHVTYLTGSIATADEVPSAYWDGDYPDQENLDYQWAGTPYLSESVRSHRGLLEPVVPPTLQWDQTACLGPPVDQGRWDDQPSTLRWDQLGSETWDAYTTEGA
jgi:hypothetical protein